MEAVLSIFLGTSFRGLYFPGERKASTLQIVNGCAAQQLVARRDVIAPEFISYG